MCNLQFSSVFYLFLRMNTNIIAKIIKSNKERVVDQIICIQHYQDGRPTKTEINKACKPLNPNTFSVILIMIWCILENWRSNILEIQENKWSMTVHGRTVVYRTWKIWVGRYNRGAKKTSDTHFKTHNCITWIVGQPYVISIGHWV
jgi:hypothetical protein